MEPLAILGSGMVTGVGLMAAPACAAIRCGLTHFVETRFRDEGGEWIIGSVVPLDHPWRGRTKLLKLITPAVRECLVELRGVPPIQVPLILCVAEEGRPGRIADLDGSFLGDLERELRVKFHPDSQVLAQGRIGGIRALEFASKLIGERRVPLAIIAGGDSYLVAETLADLEEKGRILTSTSSDGFIPGEAGAAVLVGALEKSIPRTIACVGIGFGREPSPIGCDEPLRADGLVGAIRSALADARRTPSDLDYRLADLSGEQYRFKEASLAVSRVLRERKDRFELLHPADSIGEVGAAAVPCTIAVACAATRKGYAPGKTAIAHFGNDDPLRAAAVLVQVGG